MKITKLAMTLILAVSIGLIMACQNNNNQSETSTDEQSQQVESKQVPETAEEQSANKENVKVTFIELGSKNCIPCKKMEPIMDAIEKKYPEQVEVVFYDVRTREGRPYAKKYNIRVIPTQVFLDAKGNEFYRHEGFFPQKELEKILKQEGVE